jgi:hypothetical protein
MDLFAELLRPTLALSLEDATRPTGAFFRAAAGVQNPSVPRLMDLIEALLSPRQEPETPGVEESDLDLTSAAGGGEAPCSRSGRQRAAISRAGLAHLDPQRRPDRYICGAEQRVCRRR